MYSFEEPMMEDTTMVDNFMKAIDQTMKSHHLIPELFFSVYGVGRKIGKGTYGKVFAGKRKLDNYPIAIKKVSRVSEWVEYGDLFIPNEIYLMIRVADIKGVIQMYDYNIHKDTYAIVMEKPKASIELAECLKILRYIREPVAAKFFYEIWTSQMECHRAGVCHMDLKNENVIIDLSDLSTRIIDFGNAHLFTREPFTSFRGSLAYSPPEWIKDDKYRMDEYTVWCLGIMLYEMLNGCLPFRSEEEILAGDFKFKREVSPLCRDLIEKCLSPTTTRIKLHEIGKHGWILLRNCKDIDVKLWYEDDEE